MKSIKWFFKGLILFIKKMLSSDTSESSKRSMGCLIVVNTIIQEYFCIFLNKDAPELIETVFWGGIILLGVSVAGNTLSTIFKKNTKCEQE